MIVSASYRTDIPAFHADWFAGRLAAGEVRVPNPYGGRPSVVSLRTGDVDGFIFWTRNAAPFLKVLEQARAIAPAMVTYTVTGYPRDLERGVPPVDQAVATMNAVADRLGQRALVWRYDPVIWTGATDADFHRQNFQHLADRIAPLTDEVTFSAATLYAKSRRGLARSAPDLAVDDPADDAKRELLAELGTLAVERGLRPTLCSQPHLLVPPLVPAACIDAGRLADLGGAPFRARRKGNRPGCACAESRDIGRYDSCAHGCLYCYAVRDHDAMRRPGGLPDWTEPA